MELHLMELRKKAGYSSRDKFADELGVNRYTYKSWETGKVMMNLEQAYYCAVALGCTLNDLVGMKSGRTYADKRQERMNGHYEDMNETGRGKAAGSVEDIHANPANLKSAPTVGAEGRERGAA